MDNNIKEYLLEKGVDLNGALERFLGKEDLYEKFLRKFPEDRNFEDLGEALKQKDYEEVLKYAHTMKGLTANLGLNTLFQILQKMVIDLRNSFYEELDDDYKQLTTYYREICDVLH